MQEKISETQKLSATCKIWEFLKHYHPNVTHGNKIWDEDLFAILPQERKDEVLDSAVQFCNIAK